jgi:predicted transcriptional regulator
MALQILFVCYVCRRPHNTGGAMRTTKRPVLRLIVTSPEAEVLKVLFELGKPVTIKQIQACLPDLPDHSIYQRLIKLRDRYKLVIRQKVIEKRNSWHRYFLYQPAPGAREKYDWVVAKSKIQEKTFA